MPEKILGFLLLIIGVSTIIFSTYNIYQVFTKQAQPIQYFTSQNTPLDFSSLTASLPSTVDTSKLISTPAINDGFNLTLHLFLMGIISSAGYKLASLGVQLVRAIEVKLIKSPFETIYPKPKEEKPKA
jgi:hypothetical protein